MQREAEMVRAALPSSSPCAAARSARLPVGRAQESEAGHVEELTQAERENLLAALKEKWDDTNRRYQLITHMTKLDTIGKVRRKERYEEELAQLEKDISMLSQKRPIVVADQ